VGAPIVACGDAAQSLGAQAARIEDRALHPPARPAQRLSRAVDRLRSTGDPRRDGGAAHPEAPEGKLLPGLPRPTAGGGE
jgi:hypothetical protein